MQDIPADTKTRGPSSRVLQEVIRQAPAEYVTIGWLTSTLHRHSFGIIMLSLGLLATTPVGSTIPGFILAVMAVQLIVGRVLFGWRTIADHVRASSVHVFSSHKKTAEVPLSSNTGPPSGEGTTRGRPLF